MEVEIERVVEKFLDVEGNLRGRGRRRNGQRRNRRRRNRRRRKRRRRKRTGLKTRHYIFGNRAIVGEADFDGDVEEQIVVGMNVEGESDGKMGRWIEEEIHLA